MNNAFGSVEQLPFDLKHKAVRVQYGLHASPTKDEIKIAKKSLAGRLHSELRMILEDPRSILNLSDDEYKVAKGILDGSEDVAEPGHESVEKISERLSMSVRDTKRAVADLLSRGYLQQLGVAGMDSPPVKPQPLLY